MINAAMCLCLLDLICVIAPCLFRILSQNVSAPSTEFRTYALKKIEKGGDVGSRVRYYRQNGGTALNPLPLFRRHGPGMKELGFMILTCFFLYSAELTEENIKVLIVFERSMSRHKTYWSCGQRIIDKVNH